MIVMADNDTTKAFNKSEILPFTFINELVNKKSSLKQAREITRACSKDGTNI